MRAEYSHDMPSISNRSTNNELVLDYDYHLNVFRLSTSFTDLVLENDVVNTSFRKDECFRTEQKCDRRVQVAPSTRI